MTIIVLKFVLRFWLLELEGYNLRFRWHDYLWYDNIKVNKDIIIIVRCAIFRV